MLQVPGQDAILKKDGQAAAEAFQDAIEVNIRPECRDMLAPIVAAIRYAENGGKGKEYGILHPRVKPTYRSQAGWCALLFRKTTIGGSRLAVRGSLSCSLGIATVPLVLRMTLTG
jgi:hypothetical protein